MTRSSNSSTWPAQAGVKIDLIVRGMCSLRPGIPGISENIRVVSIVDRYLEHARAFYFHNGGNPTFWLASADWMPRNFNRRIEIAFPVVEPALQMRLKEILELQLTDTIKGWWMQSDGSYVRNPRGRDASGFKSVYYENLQLEERSGSSKSMAPSTSRIFARSIISAKVSSAESRRMAHQNHSHP